MTAYSSRFLSGADQRSAASALQRSRAYIQANGDGSDWLQPQSFAADDSAATVIGGQTADSIRQQQQALGSGIAAHLDHAAAKADAKHVVASAKLQARHARQAAARQNRGGIGGFIGSTLGAVAGSVVPGVGTALGARIGGGLGGLFG